MTLKNTIKALGIVYILAGSAYIDGKILTGELTGHQGCDLSTGRVQPTKLEKHFLKSLGFSTNDIVNPQYSK